jgi:very-short-patch-repair endonuclease
MGEHFICKYCGKICKNANSFRNHERLCKMNPNRQISPFVKYNASDKKYKNHFDKANKLGIDKPKISSKVIENAKHLNKGYIPLEQRLKISVSRKRYLNEHPDKIPYKLNHSSKISYPEQYFIKLFENENIPLKYHKQISRYELDFYNEDLMKYIEIDGEQHYSDYMIQHDIERTEFLNNLGWTGMRIRWAEYQKLSENNKHNKIQEIKDFLVR